MIVSFAKRCGVHHKEQKFEFSRKLNVASIIFAKRAVVHFGPRRFSFDFLCSYDTISVLPREGFFDRGGIIHTR